LQNRQFAEYFIKVGKHMGLTDKEIGEAVLTAGFAMASTIFSNVEPRFEALINKGEK
jgi:hypothetical protein